jgi:hypothetical protein
VDILYPDFFEKTQGACFYKSKENKKLYEILTSCLSAGFLWHDNCHNVALKCRLKIKAIFLGVKPVIFIKEKYHANDE